MSQLAGDDAADAGFGDVVQGRQGPDRQLPLGEHFGQPIAGALALGDQHDPPAVADPLGDVVECGLGVAAVGLADLALDDPRLDAAGARPWALRSMISPSSVRMCSPSLSRAIDRPALNGRQRPPGQPAGERSGAYVGERLVGRGAEVDRGLTAAGRRGPGGVQELLAGLDQLDRPAADQFRVADQDVGVRGQQVDQQLHPVDQRRRQGLHPVDGMALGDPVQHVDQLGMGLGQLERAAAYVVGEQQLTARRGDHLGDRDVAGPLVGDREVVDLLDGVAEEVDPDRVLLGRREDVDDAAADRELATPLDHVHPHVRGPDQGGGQLGEIDVLADGEPYRLQVAEPLDLRLQHAADRGDHHFRRWELVVAGEPAEHREPTADRVRPRAQPFVRQRLPGRVVDDLVGSEQALQGLGEVLGLAEGGGDQEHGYTRAAPLRARGQRSGDQRPHRRRRGEVERRQRPGLRVGDRPAEGGFGAEEIDESGTGSPERPSYIRPHL